MGTMLKKMENVLGQPHRENLQEVRDDAINALQRNRIQASDVATVWHYVDVIDSILHS